MQDTRGHFPKEYLEHVAESSDCNRL